MERDARRPRAAWLRPAVSVAVVALVASPALRQRDSYPLSTYPVYAGARPAVADLPTAVGVTATGDRVRLSPTVIGDSDDPLIVADRVGDAIAQGRAERLCRVIAGRANGNAGTGRAPLTSVEVVTEETDLVATVADGAPPLARTVHATCPVAP
ncbi:MAG: hypothetical protein OEY41_05605 [Acidimicrobiia bacterium]|nr:hypothetical protein [Acidimicrobiia bacterium]MDH4362483.1 hypothetical protein [Acidimicrobiia bacterium]MDH5289455.1 hypothetical protein [Acidimicrobiia bacterium]